jgi:hypothetical protein
MGKPTSRNGLVLLVEHIDQVEGTRGTETSKYPEEEKESSIPLVVASEKGRAQTKYACISGVADHPRGVRKLCFSRSAWESGPQKVKAL